MADVMCIRAVFFKNFKVGVGAAKWSWSGSQAKGHFRATMPGLPAMTRNHPGANPEPLGSIPG